jgi:hypothetical protein
MMTTGKENLPDQRTTIERLLDDEQVLVHVNPAATDVELPPHLRDSRTVTLRLSRYFKGELFTDETKVTADLLFGSSYFSCVIPWKAIWGASSIRDEEFLWAEAAPPDILELALAQQQRQSTTKAARQGELPKQTSATPGQKKSVSHLRRVK